MNIVWGSLFDSDAEESKSPGGETPIDRLTGTISFRLARSRSDLQAGTEDFKSSEQTIQETVQTSHDALSPALNVESLFARLKRRAVAWEAAPSLSPDYDIAKVIGRGGMGTVHSARQMPLSREVAIKVIREDRMDADSQHRFFTEAVITAELDHPNIVPLHEFGIDQENRPFYSMKRVRGIPWSEVIGSKTLHENVQILLRVCDAIAFAHTRGIVHCDLKPENVMIGEFGEGGFWVCWDHATRSLVT